MRSLDISNTNKWRPRILLAALCALGGFAAATAQQQQEDDQDKQRDVVNKQFLNKRPGDKNKPPPPRPKKEVDNDLVGLTFWRLRPAPAVNGQDRPRLLTQGSKGATSRPIQWMAERASADATFSKDDPVRLSIESPVEGEQYLYVIDREMYKDGSFSEPYLIFPTLRTRDGNNVVTSGKLVDIPAATDDPPFFNFQGMQPNVVGERLTIIVSPTRLNVPRLESGPVKLDTRVVEKWEKDWGGKSEQWEQRKLAGQEWTSQEKASASEPQRLLTQGDPLPQTIFRVKGKSSGPLLIVVPMRVNP
jgi:hypothetical protein